MPKRIQLQPRDLDILASVAIARLLTAQEIEWLHYPAWRAHYRAYLAQPEPRPPYRIRPRVYRRLAELRACGLLTTAARRSYQVQDAYDAIPSAVCLTHAGVALLMAERDVDPDTLLLVPHPERAAQHSEHTLQIGRCYAALRAAIAERGWKLDDWMGDALLRASQPGRGPGYDQITLPNERAPIALIPDATFVLDGTRSFLEIDRGTHRMGQWQTKLRAYERYQDSPQLRSRYGAETFRVLVVAPDACRMERTACEIASVAGDNRASYRLLDARLLHPTTIRRGWRLIDQIELQARMAGQTLVNQVTSVSLAQAPLWEAPREGGS
jgi:hypothetical protein